MTRINLVEAGKWRSAIIQEHCDPLVAIAVSTCLDSFKQHDSMTIGVSSRSIRSKIAKYLDLVFAEFAQQNAVALIESKSLSGLIGDQHAMEIMIHEWARRAIEQAELGSNQKVERVVGTVDTVRNFVRFCRIFQSVRIPIQVAQQAKDGSFTYYKCEQRIRERKSQYPKPVEVWFDEAGRCQLCCNFTQAEKFKIDRIKLGDKVDKNIPLYVRSLSPRYCANHASTEGDQYKRDLTRRGYWHAMMRAVVEVRSHRNLRALHLEELREITYEFVFPQKRIMPIVKKIYDYVKRPHLNVPMTEMRFELADLLLKLSIEIKATQTVQSGNAEKFQANLVLSLFKILNR